MIKDGQVRTLFRLLDMGLPLTKAARKTDMDEKTARKYRQARQLPSERITPRWWQTRSDAFAEVWPEVEKRLTDDPKLQALTLFRWLQKRPEYQGRFADRQRRTFERRVRRWRATQGPGQAVMFAQVHPPGDLGASDFTNMNALEVTIGRQPFPHLLYHFTLTYSNWESVTVCPSESFEALSVGLQNALWELGGVPRRHRTDRLTAAVNNLSDDREFQERYRGLLAYYGLEGQRINARQAHENGDVESSHGHFKTAVDQALRLRGSRDFACREEYEQFLRELVSHRNANRQKAYAEEQPTLRELPLRRLPSVRRVEEVTVGVGSTIRVLGNVYSVHSRLIGEEVDVVIGMEEVEVWYAGQVVQRMPRLTGSGKEAINYRHVIDCLVRKPGAFENYVYREQMFPTSHFRMAYDALCGQHAGKRAVREYLKILQLAARESEAAVQDALRAALDRGEAISFAAVRAVVQSAQQVPAPTEVQVAAPDLHVFDTLLDHNYMEVERHEFCTQTESRVVIGATLGEVAGAAGGDAAQRTVVGADAERVAGSFAVERGLEVPVAAIVSFAGGERGVEGATSGTSLADVPRALPESGGASGAGVAELPAVPGGVDASGMPDAAAAEDPAAAAGLASAAGEDLGELRLEADPLAGGASGGEPPRRVVPGPPGELAGVRQAGLGEDALPVCVGRTSGASGPRVAVHHHQPAGAEPAGGEAGPAVAEDDQATVAVRRPDPRRPGLCAAQPRGDGSAVHLAGRALRARQRAADEQPAVLSVGADLQGCHDHSRRDRPLGASLRDLGTERPQLPPGDRPAQASPHFPASSARTPGGMITARTRKF